MTAEFDWWLLIVGLVIGAGLVWLVIADTSHRDADVENDEIRAEASWIAGRLSASGDPIEPATAEEVLREHLAYMAAPTSEDPDVADAATAPVSPGTPRTPVTSGPPPALEAAEASEASGASERHAVHETAELGDGTRG